MHKEFLPYETVRNNALKMAYKIYNDGFVPDVIYVSLRGGAYLANVVSEFFKIVRRDTHPVLYAAVVARSYSIFVNETGLWWTGGLILRTPSSWRPHHAYRRYFDTGKTINHLVEILLERQSPCRDIKVAVHDYK